SSSAQKLGDKMQANAAAKQSAQHSGAASNDSASHSSKQEAQSDDVVDAEFEEVKEHK
ncbi:phosphoribosylaminoimidazole carboxylase (NCAIR synthetase), partial [Undibacterium sp. GrIS 1.8]